MPQAPGTADRILDAAERRVRSSGYNGFSFRDLAQDVEIKSASVHHHFPTKEALVAALAERYADRFLEQVADSPVGPARVEAYRQAFRESLARDRLMCLCGMLGAESGGLPESVVLQTREFFTRTRAHLAAGLEGHADDPTAAAEQILARLEGALLMARTTGDAGLFDRATERLI